MKRPPKGASAPRKKQNTQPSYSRICFMVTSDVSVTDKEAICTKIKNTWDEFSSVLHDPDSPTEIAWADVDDVPESGWCYDTDNFRGFGTHPDNFILVASYENSVWKTWAALKGFQFCTSHEILSNKILRIAEFKKKQQYLELFAPLNKVNLNGVVFRVTLGEPWRHKRVSDIVKMCGGQVTQDDQALFDYEICCTQNFERESWSLETTKNKNLKLMPKFGHQITYETFVRNVVSSQRDPPPLPVWNEPYYVPLITSQLKIPESPTKFWIQTLTPHKISIEGDSILLVQSMTQISWFKRDVHYEPSQHVALKDLEDESSKWKYLCDAIYGMRATNVKFILEKKDVFDITPKALVALLNPFIPQNTIWANPTKTDESNKELVFEKFPPPHRAPNFTKILHWLEILESRMCNDEKFVPPELTWWVWDICCIIASHGWESLMPAKRLRKCMCTLLIQRGLDVSQVGLFYALDVMALVLCPKFVAEFHRVRDQEPLFSLTDFKTLSTNILSKLHNTPEISVSTAEYNLFAKLKLLSEFLAASDPPPTTLSQTLWDCGMDIMCLQWMVPKQKWDEISQEIHRVFVRNFKVGMSPALSAFSAILGSTLTWDRFE